MDFVHSLSKFYMILIKKIISFQLENNKVKVWRKSFYVRVGNVNGENEFTFEGRDTKKWLELFNFNGHAKQALIDKVVKLMQMKKRRKYEQILRDYIAMTHIRELYV